MGDIHQTGVRRNFRRAYAGQVFPGPRNVEADFINLDPGSVAAWELTVTNDTAGQTVSFVLNGTTYSYVLPTGVTTPALAAKYVVEEIWKNANVTSFVAPMYRTGSAVIRFLGTEAGALFDFTLVAGTGTSGATRLATGTNASAVPFGVIVMRHDDDENDPSLGRHLLQNPNGESLQYGEIAVKMPGDLTATKYVFDFGGTAEADKDVVVGVRVGRLTSQIAVALHADKYVLDFGGTPEAAKTAFLFVVVDGVTTAVTATTGATLALSATALAAAVDAVAGVAAAVDGSDNTKVNVTADATTDRFNVYLVPATDLGTNTLAITKTATSAAHATLLASALDAVSGITAAVDGDDTTLVNVTPTTAGDDIEVWIVPSDDGTTTLTLTLDTVGDVLERDLYGLVSYKFLSDGTRVLGDTAKEIGAKDGGGALVQGFGVVRFPEGQPLRTDTAYVGTIGAEKGLVYNAASSGRVPISWIKFEHGGRDGLAFVRLLQH